MAATPLSPVLATRKRRHSSISGSHAPKKKIHETNDLTGDGSSDDEVEIVDRPQQRTNGVQAAVITNGTNGSTSSSTDKVEDDLEEDGDVDGEEGDEDVDEDDALWIEEIIDTAELDPYTPYQDDEASQVLPQDIISQLRKRLVKVGAEQFWDETIESNQFTPALLGTAFGINPVYAERLGEPLFSQILVRAILRAAKKRQKLAEYNTIDDVARLLRDRSNIMVITGAGISTSLGIPDFRSKGTGFYSKLQDLGYSEPEEVFDIHEFDSNPQTFYSLAGDILPDLQRHSPTHAFIRLIQDKGKLQTNYTQNIDNLEELAGIKRDKLIQAHGSFATATCRKCGYKVKGTEIFDDIRNQRVAICKRCTHTISTAPPKKTKPSKRHTLFSNDDDESEDDDIPTPGIMKPDITFFGEQLPSTFFDRFKDHDAKTVDLVLVIGTSLKVAPVSEMVDYLPKSVPAVYVGREVCAHVQFDVQLVGECDTVAQELCKRAGWEELDRGNGLACQVANGTKGSGGKVVVEQLGESGYHWTIKRSREKEEDEDWEEGKIRRGSRDAERFAGKGFAAVDVTRSI